MPNTSRNTGADPARPLLTVIDGGMGKELHRIGAPFGQPEWSALALLEDPPSVVRAHRNFVEAGAEVITANSYAVVPFHIGAERFEARGRELADLAGRLARQAADEASRPVRVAASLPPLFGSYAPESFDPSTAPAMFDVLIEGQAPHVDLWLAETIGSCAETDAVGQALDRHGVEGERWLAFSLADDLVEGRAVLWSGEAVADGIRRALAAGADAVLLNCATPESISLALPEVIGTLRAEGRSIPVGAYANAFPPRPPVYAPNSVILGRRDDLTADGYGDHASAWVAAGATIIGGCCGVHPEHIAELVRRARSAGGFGGAPSRPAAAIGGDTEV